jgi:hypothetical protein
MDLNKQMLYIITLLHYYHKSHITRPGLEPGPPRWEASE